MGWTEKPIERVDDLLHGLITKNQNSIELGSGRNGYRGHADKTWKLVPSLDRSGPADQDYVKRRANEDCIIDEFRIRTQRFFDDLERRFLAGSSPTVEACAVAQHYGAPTRLLDWSYSPFVALYIAAIEHPDRDGVLFWFSRNAFDHKVGASWVKHKCERLPSTNEGGTGQININREAFRLDAADWISGLDYPLAFPRLSRQHGFFTIAGRLGTDHGQKIDELLPEGSLDKGKWIIPARLKAQILDHLELMNINGATLGFPSADHYGRMIAESRRRLGQ